SRTASHRRTSVHPTLLKEPSSQKSTPCVVSASADNRTVNEVRAEKSCMAATPDSTTRSMLPPRVWLSSMTIPNESRAPRKAPADRSEEHTSELQSRFDLVCRLLLE